MNKQNLWFVSLFSIILVLLIYYISIPNNLLENIEPTIAETHESVDKFWYACTYFQRVAPQY